MTRSKKRSGQRKPGKRDPGDVVASAAAKRATIKRPPPANAGSGLSRNKISLPSAYPQGLQPPQGLHGLHAAHGLQALQAARTIGFSLAETAVGSVKAPAIMVTTVTATMVSFNLGSTSPLSSLLIRPGYSNTGNRVFETWTVRDNGGNNSPEKGSRAGIAIS